MYQRLDKSPASNGLHAGQLQDFDAFTTQSPKPDREPQILQQYEILRREIDFQQETIAILRSRLEAVMSLAPPVAEVKENQAKEPTCPLAASLLQAQRNLSANTAIINEILRRLEL